jgi:tetratricopeptide (TPR) repeat protein
MFSFSNRLIYALSNKISTSIHRRRDASEYRLTADFSKLNKSLFEIKPETSHNAYLSNGSLVFELKKSRCTGWTEIPNIEFGSHVIEAKIRIDSMGGYSSTGFIFRLTGDSYYLALVSSRGYFRVDAIKDDAPKALIAWTEISGFDGTNIHLKIIAYGDFLIFIVNGKWVGEAIDDSVSDGHLGFALASYESAAGKDNQTETETVCKAWLDYFSVDTRVKTLEEQYKYWTIDSNISVEGRLRLAETFAVMGKFSKALELIKKTWKCRDEAVRAVSTSAEEVRTKKELILAARMAFNLGQYSEAEVYINLLIEQWPQSAEARIAHTEKIKILNELGKFRELKEFALKHSGTIKKDIDYYTILARCYWELKEYDDSAKAWKITFRMNGKNGVYAANAANALELSGNKEETLAFFIEAAKIFLAQDNQAELVLIMQKLSVLGEKNWEARVLAGKWAFSIEDYSGCIKEFAAAEKLRLEIKPKPAADPALFYLWGLSEKVMGKTKDAIRLLEKAVKLAPDYGLFRFKLAELKLTTGVKNIDIVREFKLALESIDDDMKKEMASHAGNLLLNAGDENNAKFFFDVANKLPQRKKAGKRKANHDGN